MTKEEIRSRRAFYSDHLTEVILPYWLPKIDHKHGGFFTCYDPTGRELVSTDKYVWSQGRCTWMYSKLAHCESVNMPCAMREACTKRAEMGARYLMEHCFLPNGMCAFRLSGDNKPLELTTGSGYGVSNFADCFVALGLSAAGVLLGQIELVQKASELFHKTLHLLSCGQFRTAPDVLPNGWRSHASVMIMVNTGDELSRALRTSGLEKEAIEIDKAIVQMMEDICLHFISPTGIVHECLTADNGLLESLYGRHINPGHTNESMWFLIRAGQRLGRLDVVEKAIHTIRCTSSLAWDTEYGGMMYYLDREGGKPRGEYAPEEAALAEAAVRDWSNKLWWPHTETIYANLLCYAQTGEREFLESYQRYHNYTFDTFPNPDKTVGEWIQLRYRDGSPNLGIIGGRLPVKDPYHITRNLMLLTDLLEDIERGRKLCDNMS